MKYKVAKSPYKTIGENKNKTNWNTYEVIRKGNINVYSIE